MTFGGSLVRNAGFGDLTESTQGVRSEAVLLDAVIDTVALDDASTSARLQLSAVVVVVVLVVLIVVVVHKSAHKRVPQEFPTRVSHKSVLQDCPTRVS